MAKIRGPIYFCPKKKVVTDTYTYKGARICWKCGATIQEVKEAGSNDS